MKQSSTILLIDPDLNFSPLLKEYLELRHYTVIYVTNGEEALTLFGTVPIDLCLADAMMGNDFNTFELTNRLRSSGNKVPIIIYSTDFRKETIIEGYKCGIDDYVVKPFSMEEVILRIKAILRRTLDGRKLNETIYKIGSIEFNAQKHTLKTNKQSIKLTTKESDLLNILASSANEMVTREQALREVWNDSTLYNSRSMDVYITKLRRYITDDPEVSIINIHGHGYKLVQPEEE